MIYQHDFTGRVNVTRYNLLRDSCKVRDIFVVICGYLQPLMYPSSQNKSLHHTSESKNNITLISSERFLL